MGFTDPAEGGAIVITAAEHKPTRTFAGKGRKTARDDTGKSFRDVLAADIADRRRIAGKKYDDAIGELIQYYRERFPEPMRKD